MLRTRTPCTWAGSPLWIEVFWESVFVLVNAVQIALLWREQTRVRLSVEEEHLYCVRFGGIDRLDFRRLIRTGASETVAEGAALTSRGQPCRDLSMIVEGTVGVYVEGVVIAHCDPGDFIGEMSFLSGGNATADTRALSPVRVVRWGTHEHRSLLQSRATIQTAMQDLFSINLIDKLVRG